MIQQFFYGSSWHWHIEHLPRVMLSFNFTRTLKKPWKIDIPFMLDSGAYSVILKHGKYPYSAEDYASNIEAWKPDIAWTMDCPCEPSVRKAGNYNPREAQVQTNNNSRLLEHLTDFPISHVVQGWTLDDYLSNLDLIKSEGLLTERLAIGSVCRRGKTQEVSRIIREIRRNVPGWVKLHGFGIKTDVLKTHSKHDLYSADSMSWAYSWYGWTRNERTKEKKINGLRKYIEAIEPMLRAPEITLNQFSEAKA